MRPPMQGANATHEDSKHLLRILHRVQTNEKLDKGRQSELVGLITRALHLMMGAPSGNGKK